MAKRRTRRTTRKLPPFWLILLVVAILQGVWIFAFVRSTGTLIPRLGETGVASGTARPARVAEPPALPAPRTPTKSDPRDTEINELKLTIQNLQRRLRMDREDRMADTKVQELIQKRGSKGGE